MGILRDLDGYIEKKQRNNQQFVLSITPTGSARLEKPGCPEREWRILNHLSESGPCPLREVADELDMNQSDVKGICMRLAQMGYIVRRDAGVGMGTEPQYQ